MNASLVLRCRCLRPLQKRVSYAAFCKNGVVGGSSLRCNGVKASNLNARDIGSIVFSTVLSGMLFLTPPSLSQVQTISVDQAISSAKPLPAQKVEKKRVWFVFVVGAASLFVFINLIENNPSWFPSVARANRAMTTRRKEKIKEVQMRELETAEAEALRLTESVKEGLAEARRRRSIENDLSTPSEFRNGNAFTESVYHKDVHSDRF